MKIERTQIDEAKENPNNVITVDFGKNEEEATATTTEDDSEYEYVPLNEVVDGPLGAIRGFISRNIVIVLCMLILVIGILTQWIGQYAGTLFIAITFAVLAVFAVIALYFAWNDKKVADERYIRAKETLAPVNEKIHNIVEDDE